MQKGLVNISAKKQALSSTGQWHGGGGGHSTLWTSEWEAALALRSRPGAHSQPWVSVFLRGFASFATCPLLVIAGHCWSWLVMAGEGLRI
jgi:hypothetical protein